MNPTSVAQEVLRQLTEAGLATPSTVRGCTEPEIVVLEQELGIMLPRAYRAFLSSIRLWPIHGCSRHGFTPNSAAWVPNVWRSVCHRLSGSPARRQIRWITAFAWPSVFCEPS